MCVVLVLLALVRSSLLWVKPLVPPLTNGVSLCGLWSSWHMLPAQLLNPCARPGARRSWLPPPCPGRLVKWSQCTAITDTLEYEEPGPVLSALSIWLWDPHDYSSYCHPCFVVGYWLLSPFRITTSPSAAQRSEVTFPRPHSERVAGQPPALATGPKSPLLALGCA